MDEKPCDDDDIIGDSFSFRLRHRLKMVCNSTFMIQLRQNIKAMEKSLSNEF